MEIVRQIKETSCHIAYNPQKEEEGKTTPTTRSYELPDGSRIEVIFIYFYFINYIFYLYY